ncbi:MAG TPA: hypothetical protein VFB37_13055 [Steroidobacteraceae bacterium]|nr:hypothetical protein [Steroidobacteraceae bacterium]
MTTPDQRDTLQSGERRRLSKIVHDHKGTASVVWHDAPTGLERPVFEIEGARQPGKPASRGLNTGSLSIHNEDTFNPYARVPESDQKGGGRPKDLRRLSAWIKLMRQLEESKRKNQDEEDEPST